ncbi:hypothetical protein AcV5_001925 [Taiwanofungus camphoratus]|nr:hypothetical protein AcV5_001925 [Antrodia cinnamomea]
MNIDVRHFAISLLCFFNILAITLRVLDVADTPSNWLVPCVLKVSSNEDHPAHSLNRASSIIVSRCLLNLQRQKLSGSGLSSNSSRPSFVRSQGALGAHQQISNIQSAPDADTWPVMPLNEVRSDPALDALDNGTTV